MSCVVSMLKIAHIFVTSQERFKQSPLDVQRGPRHIPRNIKRRNAHDVKMKDAYCTMLDTSRDAQSGSESLLCCILTLSRACRLLLFLEAAAAT